MGQYDISERFKVIERGLITLGLDYRHGSRHDIATCPETGRKTNVPRHKQIKKSTVGSICEFLVANGYKDEAIKKAFKWK